MLETDLAFVILIGGASSRFGEDKGLHEFNGKPLLQYQLETILPFENRIIIAARNQEQIDAYLSKMPELKPLEFVMDLEPNFNLEKRTPLLGLYTSLEYLAKDSISKAFVMSCDMPFIKKKVVEILINGSVDHDCVIPRWDNGYLEPLCAIYPVEPTFKNVKMNLKKQKHKLIKLLDDDWSINYLSIEREIKPHDQELSSFTNINFKQDLEHFIQ